jgi:hypothetical protein
MMTLCMMMISIAVILLIKVDLKHFKKICDMSVL